MSDPDDDDSVTFYELMIFGFLTKKKSQLTNATLRRYIGGKFEMRYEFSGDTLAGRIDDIDLAAGTVEISCAKIERRVYRGRIFRPFERENTVVVSLCHTWSQNKHGFLEIDGGNGTMTLKPPE